MDVVSGLTIPSRIGLMPLLRVNIWVIVAVAAVTHIAGETTAMTTTVIHIVTVGTVETVIVTATFTLAATIGTTEIETMEGTGTGVIVVALLVAAATPLIIEGVGAILGALPVVAALHVAGTMTHLRQCLLTANPAGKQFGAD
jgi:hypothetical protein